MLHHVPTAAAQDAIFAEFGRVLRPGGVLVAADAVYSPDLLAFHEGDTYNPIDPDGLSGAARRGGFERIDRSTASSSAGCAPRTAKAVTRAAPDRSRGCAYRYRRP